MSRWYHGTSRENARRMLSKGYITPGKESHYKIDVPRDGAIYVTHGLETAEFYASGGFTGRTQKGTVLEVSVDPSKLIPDEDAVFELLVEESQEPWAASLDDLGKEVRAMWFKRHKAILIDEWDTYELWEHGQPDPRKLTSDEAWEEYQETLAHWSETRSSGLSQEMMELTDYIVEHNPSLAQRIVMVSGLAAHLGPVKITGIVRSKRKLATKAPGRGPGWWGERGRHSAAALKGRRR
jgi:hypothetical protein